MSPDGFILYWSETDILDYKDYMEKMERKGYLLSDLYGPSGPRKRINTQTEPEGRIMPRKRSFRRWNFNG